MKTTKPISVLVIGMEPTPTLEQLVLEGHTVEYLSNLVVFDPTKWDLLIGPRLWRYLPDVSDKFIKLIVKEARAAQPPRPKKEKVKKSGTVTS